MAVYINADSYKPYEEKMKTSISVLQGDFQQVRVGRANPAVLDKITVDYYGVDTPLEQVANIQVPEAKMITIAPWESSMLAKIERAIHAANIGINPINDGKCIRLIFPRLSEEDRIEITKDINRMGENAKVAIRNIRREALDTYKDHQKQNEISEDEYYTFEKEMQNLTDTYTDKIDKMVEIKNADVMEV